MKRKIILVLILFLFYITTINAYTLDSDNNPGQNYNGSSGSSTSSQTYWPKNPIKAIRIRVFRGENEIKNSYYSLAETEDRCYSSVKGAKVCETPSYNYSSISQATATCTPKDVSLGCIVSDNLESTWYVEDYDGTYLNDYLTNNEYSQLKAILSNMGYDDSNFNNNDVIIVEPVTVVYCAGTQYFGTSTALMNKNISYNSKTNNVCSSDDPWAGYAFYNVYRSMSQALKVTINTFSDSNYSGFGYFKYDVSGMGYTPPTIPDPQPEVGNLQIKKVKNNGEAIINKNVKFYLYTDSSCSIKYDDKAIEGNTGGDGIGALERKNLPLGTYYIQEAIDGNPEGYVRSTKCEIVQLTTNGETVTIPYINYTECERDFIENSSISNRITLYKNYGFRNLLNFNITSASEACSVYTPTYNSVNECLYSEQSTKNKNGIEIEFNEYNISNYNDVLRKEDGIIIGYCLTSFKLEKLIEDFGIVNAGQMIIDGGNVVKTNLNQICYVFEEYNKQEIIYNSKSYYEYITNIKLDDKRLVPSKELSPKPDTIYLNKIARQNNLYEGEFGESYSLDNPIYVKILTGKICTDKSYDCKYIGNGIISNFVDAKIGKGNFNFLIEGDKIFDFESKACEYEVKDKIITYGDDPSGKLELEFRSIDIKNPFNDREPNENWSNPDDVQNEIIESVNSYGLDQYGVKQDPIYKITLTPTDIKTIREYNKKISYDSYEVYCYKDSKTLEIDCVNAFVYDLKNGNLNKYKINVNNISVIDYNIGILQNKLQTK